MSPLEKLSFVRNFQCQAAKLLRVVSELSLPTMENFQDRQSATELSPSTVLAH